MLTPLVEGGTLPIFQFQPLCVVTFWQLLLNIYLNHTGILHQIQ